ncbi:glycoside hydrolase family 65 [Aquibacillus albus]|uniref:Glycoside hydrolase family 65 n=1 Tax=Aquibacillus albus TaxID=1168171 RepID=A0ABS2N5U7_9BACI|nr:glycoside hydrolase family 65 [Aquibacillus albus]MBM7573481.1 hypothetical protein [Aquibacillus albus]
MDRQSVVKKHSPVVVKKDRLAPLSVGNGDFGFSVDVTGLQSFPDAYETPLSTQSNWGWHSTEGSSRYTNEDIDFQAYDTKGRAVTYPMHPGDKGEAYHWLRQNPHRLQLGRIGFRFLTRDQKEITIDNIEQIHQRLDLWTGTIHSYFEVDGTPVTVRTACDPKQDIIAVTVSSRLIQEKRLQITTAFSNPSMVDEDWSKSIRPVWKVEGHKTETIGQSDHSVTWQRVMDDTRYFVQMDWSAGELQQTATHEYTLTPDEKSEEFAFTTAFAPQKPVPKNHTDIFATNEKHWADFWEKGAFIHFEGSSDPRANELERRIILSLYVTAIHSSGSIPPQETGFMYNSWFGKFHLEMHWWHAAHFPLWNRPELLMRSMDWYVKILPKARALASSQGYKGARWPKMVAHNGEQTPSPIAPGLIWQQPHPIALAELCYKSEPSTETLEKWQDVVFESADFMVSYSHWEEEIDRYVLGPPLIPAQENHDMEVSKNPPYELEYWRYGLELAIRWAGRLGVPANTKWKEVAERIAEPPHKDDVYLAHEHCPDTFETKNHDHPSMVAALGVLPGKMIDAEKMRKTLYKVRDEWQWETAWGWDFPMCAMTAARLGERSLVVDFLMMDQTKNTYLVNGHNYQREGLTVYLPGNGALLTAIAMMASGWEGSESKNCPGFPNDGTWKVEQEGLRAWL